MTYSRNVLAKTVSKEVESRIKWIYWSQNRLTWEQKQLQAEHGSGTKGKKSIKAGEINCMPGRIKE